ncbi:pre-mRNA splicing regulator USH1G isoform X2 [Brachyhypopomus gauderio]|uniref:pre-mRNA splicing regulator USH1G isoform X2 n=1 Tax=Brachyhypopomus gauderio TaxID=698409 RepID=UPI0040427452
METIFLLFSTLCPRGDPDKCDIWGNTSLHVAAANGHVNCLTFLVSFGANVWCLDNDYHTPLDMAATRGHMDCVRYLDSIVAKQTTLNPKLVSKLKERAVRTADRRISACARLQHKHQLRMQKHFLKEAVAMDASDTASLSSSCSSLSYQNPQFSHVCSTQSGGYSSSRQATLHFTVRAKTMIRKHLERKKQGDSTFRISEDGRRSVRSLSGLQLGSDVLFLRQSPASHRHIRNMFNPDRTVSDEDDDMGLRALSEPGLYSSAYSEVSEDSSQDSLFSRPGLGTLVFRRRYGGEGMCSTQEEAFSVGSSKSAGCVQNVHQRGRLRDCPDSHCSGSLASLQDRNLQDLPWEEDDLGLEDHLLELQSSSSALEVFLATQGLSDYLSTFLRENMDLEALLLCSEADLANIHIPLGPRKRLLEACRRRSQTLQQAGALHDTEL